MSFLIVNTARTASRAFHLNVNRQSAVFGVSRYALDEAVTDFTQRNNPQRLQHIGRSYVEGKAVLGGQAVFGAVFHGVRPRLRLPFNDPINVRLLQILRDQLEIDTVFFPLRDPKDALRSELNRTLAASAGDWQFADGVFGWKRPFTLHDLSRSPALPHAHQLLRLTGHVDLEQLVARISQRTGKYWSLYSLFSRVFPHIHFVDYAEFVKHPVAVLEAMGRAAGFSYTDSTLAHTRLNSLSNRFLIYNPISLHVFGKLLRFRLELGPVLELCRDWGEYLQLDYDCSSLLSHLESELGAPLRAGINASDYLQLSSLEKEIIRRPDFQSQLFESLLPIFWFNFRQFECFYKEELYLKEVPDELYAIFLKENKSEIDRTFELAASGSSRPISSATAPRVRNTA